MALTGYKLFMMLLSALLILLPVIGLELNILILNMGQDNNNIIIYRSNLHQTEFMRHNKRIVIMHKCVDRYSRYRYIRII